MDLQRAPHHVTRLEYHLVWTPKYRRKVFDEPYRTVLQQILVKAAYDHDMTVLELEIPDHVHALLALPPTRSVSDAMRILKSVSAREFFRRYPAIRRAYFWGGKLWSPSYYAETIGRANETVIQRSIRSQLNEEALHLAKLSQLKLFKA